MKNEEEKIRELYRKWAGGEPGSMTFLPVSGSYRKYYRLQHGEETVIGVFNDDRKENEAFLSFTENFILHGLPVPQVHAVDDERLVYLLSDLGDQTLFSYLSARRKDDLDFPQDIVSLYEKVVEILPEFQVVAGSDLDYSRCYPRQAFDSQSMMWDLNYFKYYFLKLAKVPFDEQKLEDDFHTLVRFLRAAGSGHFMYRDFQSRNVMLVEGEPWFIDYQGGRKGPLQYDIASLLYDAKASIPESVRERLLEKYLDGVGKYFPIDRDAFRLYYPGFVLIRILQALGAYGFRGYYENKPHFLKSIPFAIENLEHLLNAKFVPVHLPMLEKVLAQIVSNPSFRSFRETTSPLLVSISSFSYKSGIPGDDSGNGGGFVFDCRALPNPGRFEEYKVFSGKDQPVITFLEKEPAVGEFLNHAFSMVDHSIRVYIERGFTNLSVSFGCTGGQHRSVYCAGELAKHIASKFGVTVSLHHRELSK
jgi:aminoglycoside/choline kinase family phosphotransferase